MPPRNTDAEENARLRAERDSAHRELAAMRKDLHRLAMTIATQSDRLDQIVSMLRRREEQLKRSDAQVRKLRRKLGLDDPDPDPDSDAAAVPEPAPEAASEGASTPGKPGSSTTRTKASGEAGTDDTAADDAQDRSASSDEAEPVPPKGRPRSRGGRRPPPTHLTEIEERHDAGHCPHCLGRTLKRDVLVSRVYTVVPCHVRTRVIRRERVLCTDPDCNRPSVAPMPPMPCERALYDCAFLAWLVVMKFVLLVPLDRIRLHLGSQGVDLAEGTLVHLIARAAQLADAVDGEHMRQLKAGTWLAFDGTGLKALVVGQSKAWDAYLEVYTRDELTVFQFDLTKHADRLQERLNGFRGILLCDAETRNAAGFRGGEFANCNAHPRRALRDAEASQPWLAVQGARFIRALYAVEDEAEAQGLTGARLVAYRRRRSGRVLRRFRQWLEGVTARPLPPSDKVGKVARYYLKHFDDLTRFVGHAELPLDNNAAEREFQRHAKLRQASLFAGSVEGGHRWATLLGIVRTAQKCGLDVQAYLTWMFERRGTHRARFDMAPARLTPMAYREMLEKAKDKAAVA